MGEDCLGDYQGQTNRFSIDGYPNTNSTSTQQCPVNDRLSDPLRLARVVGCWYSWNPWACNGASLRQQKCWLDRSVATQATPWQPPPWSPAVGYTREWVMNRAVSGVASVVSDNPQGIRRAAEHLGGLGHRNISYQAGPEASWADGMRWRFLREAAWEMDMNVRRVGPGLPTVEGGQEMALEWLDHRTSAVIAYNDQMAMGFIRALQKYGTRIPEDVSIVGFGNSYGAGLVTPALTTVEAPLHALGSTSVSNLLAFARGARSQSRQPLVLPTRLIVRGSTSVPAHRPRPQATRASQASGP